jgi:hypothetical protein
VAVGDDEEAIKVSVGDRVLFPQVLRHRTVPGWQGSPDHGCHRPARRHPPVRRGRPSRLSRRRSLAHHSISATADGARDRDTQPGMALRGAVTLDSRGWTGSAREERKPANRRTPTWLSTSVIGVSTKPEVVPGSVGSYKATLVSTDDEEPER